MPALDKTSLRLEPVARVQELLDVDKVAVANGDGAPQLTSSFMILLRQSLDGITKVDFKLPLQVNVSVLRGACADHEEECGPLNAYGPVVATGSPPLLILFQK